MPIPAIAQRSGRPPCPCRWRQCCITMPTPRHASAEHRWPLDGGDVIALTLDGIGMGRTARCGAGSACGSTIANANILAGCRPSRCQGGDWRHASRGEICWPTVWPLSLTGRIIRRPPPCASATGRCWRRPSSAGLTRRAPHPADGCLMPLPAPWIARRRV